MLVVGEEATTAGGEEATQTLLVVGKEARAPLSPSDLQEEGPAMAS